MKFSLYVIRNTINDKVYVGQTKQTIKKRFTAHKKPSNVDCKKLYNALNKYGRVNFSIELLAQCSSKDNIDYLEKSYIKEFDSIKNGYNILEGGQAGYLRHHTAEAKEKIRQANLGKKHSKKSLEKMCEIAKKRKIFSHKQELEVVEAYKIIKSSRKLAKIYGVSNGTILLTIKRIKENG